jgi:hypothetical protein
MKRLLLLTALLQVPGTATAHAVQELLELCQHPNPGYSVDAAYCLGYVSGVGEVLSGLRRTCDAPGGPPTAGALVQVFVNWAQQNPQHWAQLSLFGVSQALVATRPCPAN